MTEDFRSASLCRIGAADFNWGCGGIRGRSRTWDIVVVEAVGGLGTGKALVVDKILPEYLKSE